MKESVLHYVWQQKLFVQSNLKTTDGVPVEIIDVGRINTDSGPDFFNAKIKIGDTVWVGNIEIHTLASDWIKHNHQFDKSYDSVILHVIKRADISVLRTNGEKIPQLELEYSDLIDDNYESLIRNKKWIPCANQINKVYPVFIESWKSSLLTERLTDKTNYIFNLLNEYNQHWEEVFYINLARSFGFGTNSQAFEMLAKSLPLSMIGKHKNNLFQLEALFFGQSGLLHVTDSDNYQSELKTEYDFLRIKYGLKQMDASIWKMLRLRPDNFPHIRIAQFTAIVYSSTKMFSKITENPNIEHIISLFSAQPSTYWNTHYLFGDTSVYKTGKLGLRSIHSLLINTIIPFVFYYADRNGNQTLKDHAIAMLEDIPAERNAIISGWQKLNIQISTAYDSQAFIQLKKCYCDEKKCLRCRIGHKVLSKSIENKN